MKKMKKKNKKVDLKNPSSLHMKKKFFDEKNEEKKTKKLHMKKKVF